MLQNLFLGLQVALIGMIVTFVGLTALIGLIKINQFVVSAINKPKKVQQTKEVTPPVITKQETVSIPKNSDNSDNVVAAISGALAIMLEGKKFKIKSIKKCESSVNAWEIVALREQNNNF